MPSYVDTFDSIPHKQAVRFYRLSGLQPLGPTTRNGKEVKVGDFIGKDV